MLILVQREAAGVGGGGAGKAGSRRVRPVLLAMTE